MSASKDLDALARLLRGCASRLEYFGSVVAPETATRICERLRAHANALTTVVQEEFEAQRFTTDDEEPTDHGA